MSIRTKNGILFFHGIRQQPTAMRTHFANIWLFNAKILKKHTVLNKLNETKRAKRCENALSLLAFMKRAKERDAFTMKPFLILQS